MTTSPTVFNYPIDEESRKFEKINTSIYESAHEASFFVANEIADLIRQRQKLGEKRCMNF